LATSPATELWDVLAAEASAESSLWAEALLPEEEQCREPIFSKLCDPPYALGVETIYEGYLLHYGRSRLFAPPDQDLALLLGDYLYAHGLVRIAQTGNVAAVHDLAELISLCSQARAEGTDHDWAVWAATSALLGEAGLDEARRTLRERREGDALERVARAAAGDESVDQARAAHFHQVG
jgi:hypothetical protein